MPVRRAPYVNKPEFFAYPLRELYPRETTALAAHPAIREVCERADASAGVRMNTPNGEEVAGDVQILQSTELPS